MQRLQRHLDLIFFALITILLAVAFFSFSPYRVPDPHRDSGIFLNIGAEILRGKVLYLQTWDNKQPLLYFINALGLWMGRGSLWGVWGLELAFLLAALLSGYRILRQSLAPFASFFVVAASFLTIFPWMGGNYSEEYSLLFQMGILAVLFLVYLPNRHSSATRSARPLAAVAIGALIGLNFCIKQSYLDVALSVGLFLLFLAWIERDRRVLPLVLRLGLGFLLVNLVFWGYFWLRGAGMDYFTSAFLFNSYYVDLGLLEWIHALLEKLEFFTTNPFLLIISSVWLGTVLVLLLRARGLAAEILAHPLTKWLALAAAGAAGLLFFVAQARGSSPGVGLIEWLLLLLAAAGLLAAGLLFLRKPGASTAADSPHVDLRAALERLDWTRAGPPALLFLGLLDLPLVLLTITLSGKDFSHYYISLFPALFLLLGGGLAAVAPVIGRASGAAVLNCLLAGLLIAGAFAPGLQIATFLSNPGSGDARAQTAAYLKSATSPEDRILVWGWESLIYFLAERESPTRYAFQFPAYLESPYQPAVLSTLLADLQQQPPVYIADTVDGGMPLVEGRPGAECLSGSRLEDAQLLAILSFVCDNYEYERSIEHINIYRLRGVQ
jgi:hypothetical protein